MARRFILLLCESQLLDFPVIPDSGWEQKGRSVCQQDAVDLDYCLLLTSHTGPVRGPLNVRVRFSPRNRRSREEVHVWTRAPRRAIVTYTRSRHACSVPLPALNVFSGVLA